jgi:hypothetical protein
MIIHSLVITKTVFMHLKRKSYHMMEQRKEEDDSAEEFGESISKHDFFGKHSCSIVKCHVKRKVIANNVLVSQFSDMAAPRTYSFH